MNIFATGWSEGFDGPGRRFVVYLKGCNFRCRWCANPESISPFPEMLFYPSRGRNPETACPHSAIRVTSAGAGINRRICKNCSGRECITVWKHPSFELAGKTIMPEDLAAKCSQLKPLFGKDGGVAFGGGEPLRQIGDLLKTIRLLRADKIDTVVETNAAARDFRRIIGRADELICDLKCLSVTAHREWTGHDNKLVLNNLREAASGQKRMRIRIPMIPGFNDNDHEISRMADYLAGIKCKRKRLKVEIMRMHHLGRPKYAALGLEYPMAGINEPAMAAAARFRGKLEAAGLDAEVVS